VDSTAIGDGDEVELARLIGDFFAAVSFGEGGRPAYDRLASMFIENGKLINTITGEPDAADVDGFIATRAPVVDRGELTSFRETETGAVSVVFGNVAHRWSSYEKAGVRDGVAFAATGMVSTQYVRGRDGWRISSMAWDDERAH
jgi:hypothetical protein